MIRRSTIQNLSFFQDQLDERIAQFKPLLEFIRPVHQKVNRYVAVNQAADFHDPVGTVMRGIAFDDQKVNIAAGRDIPPGGAAEQNNLFRLVFLDKLSG